MLIQQKLGNINAIDVNNRNIDWLQLEWYEAGKRILRRQTRAGNDIALKFLDKKPALTHGDVLYEDDTLIIAVEILPCDVLVIQPANLFEMASVCYEIGNKHLPLFFDKEELLVPFEPTMPGTTMVDVWSNRCRAQQVSEEANAWFSKQLGISCKLMYMPDTTNRFVDGRYAHNKEITSFSDGFPLLMIGQASLDDLNSRLTAPLPMNRFRPNVVFTGGTPFLEDTMKQFEINGITFFCVKPCARCVMTTIDQQSGAKAKEPLTTLSTYRKKNNKILFGQNLLYKGRGAIAIGNIIAIQEKGIVELIPD